MNDFTKEGCRRNGVVEPWTPENILEAADAEVGPSCCDESYCKIRDVMEASIELLDACETYHNLLRSQIRDGRPADAEAHYQAQRKMEAAIKKARGEK